MYYLSILSLPRASRGPATSATKLDALLSATMLAREKGGAEVPSKVPNVVANIIDRTIFLRKTQMLQGTKSLHRALVVFHVGTSIYLCMLLCMAHAREN